MHARQIVVVEDAAALAVAAAERIIKRMKANFGRISICLTGGSSPKKLYEQLGAEPFVSQIPWDRVHWFIGDDRFVKPDDPLNNMSVARAIFLDRCAPAANVHPIATTAFSPSEAAQLYETEMQIFFGTTVLDPQQPLFDLVLMGVGPDGHTASLFPGYPAVDDVDRWVVGVPEAHVAPFVPRVSLTLPALGSCQEMLFEVSGADKQAIMSRVLEGDDLPANRAYSSGGQTVWLCDRASLPENFHG